MTVRSRGKEERQKREEERLALQQARRREAEMRRLEEAARRAEEERLARETEERRVPRQNSPRRREPIDRFHCASMSPFESNPPRGVSFRPTMEEVLLDGVILLGNPYIFQERGSPPVEEAFQRSSSCRRPL